MIYILKIKHIQICVTVIALFYSSTIYVLYLLLDRYVIAASAKLNGLLLDYL